MVCIVYGGMVVVHIGITAMTEVGWKAIVLHCGVTAGWKAIVYE